MLDAGGVCFHAGGQGSALGSELKILSLVRPTERWSRSAWREKKI